MLAPLQGGLEQGLLNRVFADVEPPVAAHEGTEDLRRRLAQQILDLALAAHISVPASLINGRSSTAQ